MIDYREALGLEDGVPGVFQDELFQCPETGSGERRVFRWIFYMVSRLLSYCNPDDIFDLLQAASADCGRNTDSDILGAIKVASGYRFNSSGGTIHSPHAVRKKGKAPVVDYSRVVELNRKNGGYDALLNFCGTNPDLKATKTLLWLCDLYGAKDNLCLGVAPESVIVAPLELWGRLLRDNFMGLCQEYCFLTPNPFKPEAESRCDAGILERRYFVIEFDIIGIRKRKDESVVLTPWHPILEEAGCSGWDLQAGIIFHLFELGYPIVSIVHSGGKACMFGVQLAA